jgi:GMP synthase (glutamine-hydrolysing)
MEPQTLPLPAESAPESHPESAHPEEARSEAKARFEGAEAPRKHPTSEDLEVTSYLEEAAASHPEAGAHPEKPRREPSLRPEAPQTIVVLDFGGQTAMLIARRVRECSVYSELVSFDAPEADVRALNPAGFILSGGPASVYDEGAPHVPNWVFESGLPILGICYGLQLLAYQLGGRVEPSGHREYGHAILHLSAHPEPVEGLAKDKTEPAEVSPEGLFAGLDSSIPVWMSHGDRITEPPPGFHVLASSDSSPIAAIGNDRGYIGIQFHPEVVHTRDGKAILENFLYKVCGCRGDWSAANFVEGAVERVRAQVGSGRVICALSGGVDSAVTAALIHKAIGDQLTCVFVDNGLLRQEEPERVVDTFNRHLAINLVHVDAAARFVANLAGVTDPEQKRKIVGETFIRIFEEEADRLFPSNGPAHPEEAAAVSKGHPEPRPDQPAHPDPLRRTEGHFIAQGTTYPDVIESGAHGSTGGSNVAAVIKTHHNVGGLPDNMSFQLVEPLRYLFKDEVRQAGLALGLPEEMVFRQPFPGPGLAIRIIGQVTREKLDTLRVCDWIVMSEVKAAGLYRDLWQAFAILTDTRSVGVMGDFRTYGWVVAIRAVTAEDAMTADWARLPHDLLAKIANRIVNEVPSVNRVVYDITSKPPGTIEWE